MDVEFSFKCTRRFNMYLFPMCLLATDNEAIAETVSASSASRWRASLSEQPSVEAERCSERQYLPVKRDNEGVNLKSLKPNTIRSDTVHLSDADACRVYMWMIHSLWASITFSIEWTALAFGLCCSTSSGMGSNWNKQKMILKHTPCYTFNNKSKRK